MNNKPVFISKYVTKHNFLHWSLITNVKGFLVPLQFHLKLNNSNKSFFIKNISCGQTSQPRKVQNVIIEVLISILLKNKFG